MSSGERKRMMAKPCACDTRRGLRAGCCGIACAGSDGPAGSCRKPCVRGTGLNTWPQRVRAPYLNAHASSDRVSQVARVPWNPCESAPTVG